VPGSNRVVAPVAMITLSKVTVSVPFGPSTLNVWSPVNVAQPSNSVTLFLFIK
jgi:hypothetical protein